MVPLIPGLLAGVVLLEDHISLAAQLVAQVLSLPSQEDH